MLEVFDARGKINAYKEFKINMSARLKKIWLSSPHMGGNELVYVNEAYNTNWVAPLGPNVDEFEHDIEKYTNAKYAAALSSGTASLHLALILLGVQVGDYVICQSMTFSASANPIAYLGAKPVFIDSEIDTWNMDPELLEKAIIELAEKSIKPKAIIPVHLYGMPAKLHQVIKIGEKYGIPIIEDAAESLGSTLESRATGTFGKIGILSFNGNKIITTSAGGALIADDQSLIEKARFLATQARDDAPHYQHSHIGYNYRMSNILAGIGRGQMEVLIKRVQQRRTVNTWYRSFLSSIEGVHFQSEPNDNYFSNFWLTAITIDPEKTRVTREEVRLKLLTENIESRPLWKPMHLQPVFKDAMYFGNGVSEKLFDQGLCLPSGSNLSEEEKTRIQKSLLDTLSL
jgi:dTDP-4-amino-4,6-dideoxygalactose transaminase